MNEKLMKLVQAISDKNAMQITIKEKLKLAIQNNKEFIALTSPTNAKNATQIRKLTKQNNQIIRLLLSMADEEE